VTEVVSALSTHLGSSLKGIVLFGSRARGDARAESDWDLLVVADTFAVPPRERSRELRNVLPPRWQGAVAIIAKTTEEFEVEFPAYYLDIGLDGLILFDREAYLGDRLRIIRQRIREAGLRRERLGEGFFWTWNTPPRGPWRIDWTGVHGVDAGR